MNLTQGTQQFVDLDVLLETPGALLDLGVQLLSSSDSALAMMYARDPFAMNRPTYQGVRSRVKQLFPLDGIYSYVQNAEGQERLKLTHDLFLNSDMRHIADILYGLRAEVKGIEDEPNAQVAIALTQEDGQQPLVAETPTKFTLPRCATFNKGHMHMCVTIEGLREETVLARKLAVVVECDALLLLHLCGGKRTIWTIRGERYMSENGVVAKIPSLVLAPDEQSILQKTGLIFE